MTYLVSPTDPATPTDDQGATQGAEELRALKGYLSGLLGFPTGFNTFRKNAIINGDFNIWQRSSSFGSVPHGTYTADRWVYGKTSAVVHDVLRSPDVPSVAQAGRLFIYSYHLDCTTADAAVAAGDYALFQQLIEGYNFLPLAQNPMVLSFWVKATKIGIHCVSFCNGGFDRSYIVEYTINVANTWEKKTITVPASPNAGVWNYTEGLGLQVRFALMVGTTYQAAAGAWQVGNFLGTANQVNACDNIANDFKVTAVQLEAGTIASDFEHLTFTQSLGLCERYFEKSFPYATAPAQNVGSIVGAHGFPSQAGNIGQYVPGIYYRVRKRTLPAFITYNPLAANAQARNQTLANDCSGFGMQNNSESGCLFTITGSVGQTPDGAQGIYIHWTADAEI